MKRALWGGTSYFCNCSLQNLYFMTMGLIDWIFSENQVAGNKKRTARLQWESHSFCQFRVEGEEMLPHVKRFVTAFSFPDGCKVSNCWLMRQTSMELWHSENCFINYSSNKMQRHSINTRTHNRGQNDLKGGSQMDFSKHSGDIFLVFLDFVSNLCPHMMVVQLFR